MSDYQTLLKELTRYKQLEHELVGIDLEELIQTYKQDILHYQEPSKGLRMLSTRDYQYYLDALEYMSRTKYLLDSCNDYIELENKLQNYGVTINEVVNCYINSKEKKDT